MKINKLVLTALVVFPLLAVTAATVFLGGMRRYGNPIEYRAAREERIQAHLDSLARASAVVSPEDASDSTLVGMGSHETLFPEADRYEERVTEVKTSLDSLSRERRDLEAKEKMLSEKEKLLSLLKDKSYDQNVTTLAKLYDNMKAPQAVPMFIPMNDTLAVLIMSKMQERNAGRLLEAIAAADLEKATRLTRLFSVLGRMPATQ